MNEPTFVSNEDEIALLKTRIEELELRCRLLIFNATEAAHGVDYSEDTKSRLRDRLYSRGNDVMVEITAIELSPDDLKIDWEWPNRQIHSVGA